MRPMAESERGKQDQCAFCSEEGDLETHHIVPKKYGGTNDEVNLLTVCSDCHKVLERTYDYRFYQEMGVMAGMTPAVMFDTIKELQFALSQIDAAVRGSIGYLDQMVESADRTTLSDYGNGISKKQVWQIQKVGFEALVDGHSIGGTIYPEKSELDELLENSRKLVNHVEQLL